MSGPIASHAGTLLGIAVRRDPGGTIESLTRADVTVESGVAGDPRGAEGPRQVSVLAAEPWREACREIGADLPWTTRRANLLIEGVTLPASSGRRLRIATAVLETTEAGTPCEEMDKAHRGLRAALERGGRGGVMCRVVQGGGIRIGDPVELLPPDGRYS